MNTKTVLLFVILLLVQPSISDAANFLGAPVIPGAQAVQKSDHRLEYKTGLSHDKALSYYEEALQDLPDIKIRDWKDATYIEDDGRLAWHSVTISKGGAGETTVVIMKDNWTWIMGTLVLRYIGVFVVLLVLFLGISVSGQITSRFVARAEAKK